MALVPVALQVIKLIVDEIDKSHVENRRILSLGYPDILADFETLGQIFGEAIKQKLQLHPRASEIASWHSSNTSTKNIVESFHFFSLLGFELEVVDITEARGGEIIMNLNNPIPSEFRGRYVMAIDAGTCEHCFNIAQAMINLSSMVAECGYIYQSNPLNAMNHGFYNLNPTFYFDYYKSNGFDIRFYKVASRTKESTSLLDVDPHGPFGCPVNNSSNIVVAKKIKTLPPEYPIQTKYQKSPTLGVTL